MATTTTTTLNTVKHTSYMKKKNAHNISLIKMSCHYDGTPRNYPSIKQQTPCDYYPNSVTHKTKQNFSNENILEFTTDRLKFVYFTFFFYGICTVLPSNIFILIVEYFIYPRLAINKKSYFEVNLIPILNTIWQVTFVFISLVNLIKCDK